VAWLPKRKILFAGDLVEAQAALYTGDAFHREWTSSTLENVRALGAETLIGGRGGVSYGADAVQAAIAQTRNFLEVMIREVGAVQRAGGMLKQAFEATHAALVDTYGGWPIFEHCLPFDVSRCGTNWPASSAGDLDRRARPRDLGPVAGCVRRLTWEPPPWEPLPWEP